MIKKSWLALISLVVICSFIFTVSAATSDTGVSVPATTGETGVSTSQREVVGGGMILFDNPEGFYKAEPEEMPLSDGFYDLPFISIKLAATGETEYYSLNDLYPEGVPFAADESTVTIPNDKVLVVDSALFLLDVKPTPLPSSLSSVYSLLSPSTTRNFDWTISGNSTTYSTTQLDLDVYDKISFDISMSRTPYDISVGLWNNVNSTFFSAWNIIGSVNPYSNSFTMAVGGNFSFAIRNNQSSSIRVTGSYTY